MDRNFIYHGTDAIGMNEDGKQQMGPLAEAVDVFFDRMTGLMPTYVGKMYSIIVGLAVAAIVILLLTPFVMVGYSRSKEPDATPKDKAYWILSLVMSILLALISQVFVSDLVYRIQMIQANKQHFANVHWTSEYVRAVKAGNTL